MAWIGFCAITITCQGGNHIAIEEVCFDQGSHCIKILVESNLAFTKIESGNSDAESKKWVVLSENDIAGIYPCTGIDVAALLSSLVTTACSRNSNVALSWSVQFDNDMNFSSTVFSSNIANLRSHTFHIIFDLTTLKPHEQCRYDTFRDYNGNYSVQKSSTYNLSSISFRPHKPLEPSSPSQPLICISQTTTANTTAAATRAATQALARLWAWIDPCSETRRVIHVNTVSVSTIRRRVQHNGHSITTLFAQVQCPLVSSKTEQSITYEVTSSVGEFTATDGCSCLPLELMQHSMRWLDARGLRAMASTCRSLRLLADLLVPGLRLQLYPHQVDSGQPFRSEIISVFKQFCINSSSIISSNSILFCLLAFATCTISSLDGVAGAQPHHVPTSRVAYFISTAVAVRCFRFARPLILATTGSMEL